MITMKQTNLLKSILFSAAAGIGVAVSALGQTSPNTVFTQGTPASYGLLGQTYSSLDFAYINHKDGPPRLLHSYGAIYNAAITPGFDTGLKYHYISGSEFGQGYRNHEAHRGGHGLPPVVLGPPLPRGQCRLGLE